MKPKLDITIWFRLFTFTKGNKKETEDWRNTLLLNSLCQTVIRCLSVIWEGRPFFLVDKWITTSLQNSSILLIPLLELIPRVSHITFNYSHQHIYCFKELVDLDIYVPDKGFELPLYGNYLFIHLFWQQ